MTDVRYADGKLEILGHEGKNTLTGRASLGMGSFKRAWNFDEPGLFPEEAALRFVEALEETASSPQVREALPSSATETIDYLRRALA